MKKETWFIYTFEDGSWCYCRGLSRQELGKEIREHGKLISKEPA